MDIGSNKIGGVSQPQDPSLEQQPSDNQSVESIGFDAHDQLEPPNICNSVSESLFGGQEVDGAAHSILATNISPDANIGSIVAQIDAEAAAKAAQDATNAAAQAAENS